MKAISTGRMARVAQRNLRLCSIVMAIGGVLWSPNLAHAAKEPAHVALADRMVSELLTTTGTPNPNNSYGKPVTVTWKGIGGATQTFNRSQCASFITELLKTAYDFKDEDFVSWFGSPSPFANTYQEILSTKDVGPFSHVGKVTELQPGDLIAIKYPVEETATGHVMMVRQAAKAITPRGEEISGTTQYSVEVIDSSSGTHSSTDTRRLPYGTQQGVGRGTVRLYANADGQLIAHAWSLDGTNAYEDTERPLIAVRVTSQDPTPVPPKLTQVTVNRRIKQRKLEGTLSGPAEAKVWVNVTRRKAGRCLGLGRRGKITSGSCPKVKKRWVPAVVANGAWHVNVKSRKSGWYIVRVRAANEDSTVRTRRWVFLPKNRKKVIS